MKSPGGLTTGTEAEELTNFANLNSAAREEQFGEGPPKVGSCSTFLRRFYQTLNVSGPVPAPANGPGDVFASFLFFPK